MPRTSLLLFFTLSLMVGCTPGKYSPDGEGATPTSSAPAPAPSTTTTTVTTSTGIGGGMMASPLSSAKYKELQHGIPAFSFLSAEQNAFVASEVNRLTLKQKAGQMTQVAMDLLFKGDTYVLTTPAEYDKKKVDKILGDLEVGSILNHPSNNWIGPNKWYEYMQRIQNEAMATTGIPVLFGQDAIHGANYIDGATLYAQPLGVAASFNTDLTEKLAAMTAYQLKAASIPWNFSPAMDVGRNPTWARTWESFGEDIHLNTVMGEAMLSGYQGDDVASDVNVVACLKHFTGYGSPLSGRDRSPVYLPERQLREYYLPQYRNAINKGALSVMINSGEINGIPSHANRWLLTDVLRGELGFEGLAVSDWEDVRFLNYRYKVAANLKEAVKLAVNSGVDMSMTAAFTDFPVLLKELVEEGSIPMARIDRSVARIIALKVKAGLYEKNIWNPSDFDKFSSEEHAALSLQSAEEAIVLLKNDGLQLPFKGTEKIFLTGPTAETMRSLNGGWTYSWQGEKGDEFLERYHTIKEALELKFDGQVRYAQGVGFDDTENIEQALELAGQADVLVVCLGESSYTEIEGNIDDLNLPMNQRKYFDQLADLGKPIVLVMAAGRPRTMTDMASAARSVLYLPYPGPHAGDALANILAGETNPSGRLPLTYPRQPNALMTYDHKTVETIKSGYNPLFPFGHGLSYSSFEYGDLQLSSQELTEGGELKVTLTVTNKGSRPGKHSVLLYTRDEYASITPSMKRLRAFDKVALAAGASQMVEFTLRPEDLSFIGIDHAAVTEAGEFTVMVGDRVAKFQYVDTK